MDITKLILILVVLSLSLVGCNMPNNPTQQAPNVAAFTQAAETVIAQLTELAPGQTVAVTRTSIQAEPSATSPAVIQPSATPQPSDTPAPSPTSTLPVPPTPTENLTLVFSDDFSHKTGWYTEESDNFGFRFTQDGYEIYVNISYANIWSMREAEFADVVLEVEAARTAGPEDGYYGLTCRFINDANYYTLAIGSDGFYGIGKMEKGEYEWIEEGRDTSGIIKTGNEFNKIRGDCVGESLRLYANGQKLLEVSADDFTSGTTGLVAGTRKQPGLYVLFDNFKTYLP